MAAVQRGARSQAIRDYLTVNPQAGPNEITAALKAKGISVSPGLISSIKYGKRGGSMKVPRRRSSSNLSEAIRGYLSAHPEAKPKEIRTVLAKQGIKVGAGLVSNVKHNFQKQGGALTVRAAARRTGPSNVTFEQLLRVKQFVTSFGGLPQLRSAIDALDKLR